MLDVDPQHTDSISVQLPAGGAADVAAAQRVRMRLAPQMRHARRKSRFARLHGGEVVGVCGQLSEDGQANFGDEEGAVRRALAW